MLSRQPLQSLSAEEEAGLQPAAPNRWLQTLPVSKSDIGQVRENRPRADGDRLLPTSHRALPEQPKQSADGKAIPASYISYGNYCQTCRKIKQEWYLVALNHVLNLSVAMTRATPVALLDLNYRDH